MHPHTNDKKLRSYNAMLKISPTPNIFRLKPGPPPHPKLYDLVREEARVYTCMCMRLSVCVLCALKGGSWASTGDEASRFARFSFRRHFFQHLGFRMVRLSPATSLPPPVRLCKAEVFVMGVGVTSKDLCMIMSTEFVQLHVYMHLHVHVYICNALCYRAVCTDIHVSVQHFSKLFLHF